MVRPKWIVMAVSAAVVMLASACGHSSNGAGGSNPTAASSSGTKAPIPVGFIGTSSGPDAPAAGGGVLAFKGWVEEVNASGGINGHPIKSFIEDDQGDPAKSTVAVKALIQDDKVVAIVGESTNADTGWATYVEDSGVPVVGSEPVNASSFSNPDFFPIGTNIIAIVYGQLKEAAKIGNKFVDLYCAESTACAQSAALYSALAKTVGITVPLTAKFSSSATDYTSQCLALKNSGAQSFAIGAAAVTALRVYEECKSLGVNARFVTTFGVEAPSVYAAIPNGMIGIEAVAPFDNSSSTSTAAYQRFKAKYMPNIGDQNTGIAEAVYASGLLFEAAVKAGNTDHITSASIKRGLYSLQGETLGGLTVPLTYTQGKPTAVNCYFVTTSKDGKQSSPYGLTPQCAPDAVITGVLAEFAH